MRLRTRHFFGVACLNVLLALGSGACSSSEEQESEDLESSEEQGQQGEGDNENAGQQAQGEGEENFNAENMENSGNDAPANDNTGEAVGQGGDLQEIISEMDPANANAGGGQAAQPAPEANPAPQSAPVANAAPAPAAQPMADTSTSSAGGVIAGLAGVAAGVGLPELGSKIPYIIRSGDTLGKVSTKIYGSPARWKEIATLSGLDDPNHIYPGDVVYFQLTQEAVAFAQGYLNVPRQEVVVQQGDTLATISKRTLGSSKHWKSIWRENDHITNPDQLVVGQTVFYVTEASMAAAVKSASETIAKAIKTQHSDVAIDMLDAQFEEATTTNDFDHDMTEMSTSAEKVSAIGSSTTSNLTTTVSLNS